MILFALWCIIFLLIIRICSPTQRQRVDHLTKKVEALEHKLAAQSIAPTLAEIDAIKKQLTDLKAILNAQKPESNKPPESVATKLINRPEEIITPPALVDTQKSTTIPVSKTYDSAILTAAIIEEALTTIPLSTELTAAQEDAINELAAVTFNWEDLASITPNDKQPPDHRPTQPQPIKESIPVQHHQPIRTNPAVLAQPTLAPNNQRPRQKPAEPSIGAQYASRIITWFFKDNPLIKIGIVILFLGFGFLLKMGMDKGLFPIELRLLATAGISFSLFFVGWRLRLSRPDFGLSLQGAGLGGIYFILYAATKIFSVLHSPHLTLFAMLVICAAIIYLSMKQNAQILGFIALLGGFMAPPLMSTGGGSFLLLYAFYTLLSITITMICYRVNWQFLQLLGFIMVFGVSSLIGFSQSFMEIELGFYDPSQVQGITFLVGLNMLLYGAVLIVINRRHYINSSSPLKRNEHYEFSSALLFGTPLIGFSVLYLLLKPYTYGLAIAAVIIGLSYLLGGYWLKRFKTPTFSSEHYFFTALGLGFLTLSIPLAYTLDVTAIIWAIEGTLFLLINHKEIPRTSYIMGGILVIISACYCTLNAIHHPQQLETSTIFINALSLFVAAWRWKSPNNTRVMSILVRLNLVKNEVAALLSISAYLFWLLALVKLTQNPWANFTHNGFNTQPFALLTLLSLSGLLFNSLRRRLSWPQLIHMEYGGIALNIGITLLLMLNIPTVGYLTQAGLLNLVWIPVGAYMSYLIREFKHTEVPDAKALGILCAAWILWVLNQFLLAYIAPAYLTCIEGILLLSLRQRSNHPLIAILAALLLGLSVPLFVIAHWITHWPYTTMDYGQQLMLCLPLFYGAYRLEKHTTLGIMAYYTDIISKIALMLGSGYLLVTIHYLGVHLTPSYAYALALVALLIFSFASHFIARQLHWPRLKETCHLLLIQILITSIWLTFKPLTSATLSLHGSYVLILTLALVGYYILLKTLIHRYKPIIGAVLHLTLAALGLVLMAELYRILCVYYPTIDASLIALYTFTLPLIIYSILIHKCLWIKPFAASYQLIIYSFYLINVGLIIVKFFSAPITLFGLFIPLLNPLEFGLILNATCLYYALRCSGTMITLPTSTLSQRPLLLIGMLLILVTMTVLRLFSVYGAIQWDFIALWNNRALQASISIIWTLFAMASIIKSQRNQSHEYWLAGAIPLGIVLLKLFLVDIAKGGGLVRALLFVSIALLMIVLGYFAPMPPMKKSVIETDDRSEPH